MSQFVDEIVGGDGYRWYSLLNENGDVVQEKVRLVKNYTPERAGSTIGAAELNQKVDLAQLFDLIYPIGRVVEFGNGVDPNEVFGGTWQPYAQGRTTVGIDPNDADFNEVGKTGGSKTAKYSLENDGYAKIGGYANQPVVLRYTNKKGTGIEYIADTYATFSQGAALGPIETPYTQTRAMALGGTTDEGNNMQPYVVTRKWIRVA
jgi:hypothetical protein